LELFWGGKSDKCGSFAILKMFFRSWRQIIQVKKLWKLSRPKKENEHSDSSLHIQRSWLLCYQSCMESWGYVIWPRMNFIESCLWEGGEWSRGTQGWIVESCLFESGERDTRLWSVTLGKY
jgi:hypothetical protein